MPILAYECDPRAREGVHGRVSGQRAAERPPKYVEWGLVPIAAQVSRARGGVHGCVCRQRRPLESAKEGGVDQVFGVSH